MRAVVVPPEIAQAMGAGAALAVSISGGKDSQAMLAALVELHRLRGWEGALFAVHAHLGKAEWAQSRAHCQLLCDRLGIPLIEVNRPQGDLVDEIRDRMEKLKGTGTAPWPDAKNRYCTSDQKRDQIIKVLRNPWPTASQRYCTADQKRDQIVKAHRAHGLIVSAMGMRAEESPARRKRPTCSIGTRVTAKKLVGLPMADAIEAQAEGDRLALDWLPIHDWTEGDVWEACGSSAEDVTRRRELYAAGDEAQALDGWPAHPAYVFGNERLSCVFCVLASKNDLVNGARHNPELFREYVAIERESGFTFQHKRSLESLAVAAGVAV